MMNLTTLVAVCLNVCLIFSKEVSRPCQSVREGLCGRGQYVIYTEDFGYRCVDCPQNTFMDFDSHVCESCKRHTQPNKVEVIMRQGSSSDDNTFVCKDGYFKTPSMSLGSKDECKQCSVCEDGTWAARECSRNEDAFCCSYGMVAVFALEGDRLTCVLLEPRLSGQTLLVRKERASSRDEHNDTGLVNDGTDDTHAGADKSHDQWSDDHSHSDPGHDYSSNDYDTEYRREKVEFPIWARILCAGVAIGVFLFYLGVGIPCNACGSRDLLHSLRDRISHRHHPEHTEDKSKEKPAAKAKTSVDQV